MHIIIIISQYFTMLWLYCSGGMEEEGEAPEGLLPHGIPDRRDAFYSDWRRRKWATGNDIPAHVRTNGVFFSEGKERKKQNNWTHDMTWFITSAPLKIGNTLWTKMDWRVMNCDEMYIQKHEGYSWRDKRPRVRAKCNVCHCWYHKISNDNRLL